MLIHTLRTLVAIKNLISSNIDIKSTLVGPTYFGNMQKIIFVPCKYNILSLTWNSQINSIQWCYVLASSNSSTKDSSLLQTDQQPIMYDNINRQLSDSRLSTYCSEPLSYGLNCLPWGPNDLVNRFDHSQCSDTEKIISLSNSLKNALNRVRIYITHTICDHNINTVDFDASFCQHLTWRSSFHQLSSLCVVYSTTFWQRYLCSILLLQ